MVNPCDREDIESLHNLNHPPKRFFCFFFSLKKEGLSPFLRSLVSFRLAVELALLRRAERSRRRHSFHRTVLPGAFYIDTFDSLK
jgi:hypothetical protein